jgi:hypothetical protein
MHFFPVGYNNAWYPQDSKNIQAAGGAVGGSHIVVAYQQHNRHPFIGQALDPAGELPLKGGVGPLILVGIAGKHTYINLSLQGDINGLAETSQKINDPAIQPGF